MLRSHARSGARSSGTSGQGRGSLTPRNPLSFVAHAVTGPQLQSQLAATEHTPTTTASASSPSAPGLGLRRRDVLLALLPFLGLSTGAGAPAPARADEGVCV